MANAQMDPSQSCITFEDVFLYFTREERKFLDDAQEFLYRQVMLHNFDLVLSVGLPISRSYVDKQQEPERHRCPKCGKFFIQEDIFVRHQEFHNIQKPYKCNQCEKTFHLKDTLAQHQKFHSGERPHVCSRCGKSFIHRNSLAAHEKKHNEENGYECDKCGMLLSSSSDLLVHKRIHNEERHFVCSECGKTYNCKSNLKQHKKLHTTTRSVNENVANSLLTTATIHTRDFSLE